MTITPVDPVKVYKLAKTVVKTTRLIWWEVRHGGKEKYGSVYMFDSGGGKWKVRVRRTGNRGKYLKVDSKDNDAIKFRASADGYRPEKYVPITKKQWETFEKFARGDHGWEGRTDNLELTSAVNEVLDTIVREAAKHPELKLLGDGKD